MAMPCRHAGFLPRLLPVLLAVAAVSAALTVGAHEKEPRIHLTPLLEKGQTIRYRIDTQTSIEGSTTSPIMNPEGAKKENHATSLEVTLHVLGPPPAAPPSTPAAAEGTRFRVTYDFADASSTSDAYDPATAAFDNLYDKLQGRSMEFTMAPDGSISSITGLAGIFSNPSVADSAKAWLVGFGHAAGLPKQGIVIRQKWTREVPAKNLPLRGLVWRIESTYLRDETCAAQAPPDPQTPSGTQKHPAAGANDSSPAPQSESKWQLCAVILTESSLVRHGSSQGDATPDDYLRNGLRTSGTWTATGESLDSISLQTGWIVSSTETVDEKMDYEVKSVQSGSPLRHKGSVKTQTHIVMLPSAAAPSLKAQ